MLFPKSFKNKSHIKPFDIVTIGSAARDVYLASKDIKTVQNAEFNTGIGICASAGSKVNVDEIHFATGGSAVNTAITFALQGLNVAALCKVGDDWQGAAVKERLHSLGVAQDFILTDKTGETAYSVIMHAPSGERTIFAYRGVGTRIQEKEFDFGLLRKTKWIFVGHLADESAKLFSIILQEAQRYGVRIALNPGSTQLNLGERFVHYLQYVDILFVNQEEASVLTGIDFAHESAIFAKLDSWVSGLAVMTKGKDGVSISDGKVRWDAPALREPKFVDRTGAGDAFAAGFTAAIIKGQSIEDAVQLGSANATGVVGAWGANNGLLEKGDAPKKFGMLKINKTILE